MVEAYPELFPSTIKEGYKLDGFTPQSKKMSEVRIRRIKLKTKPDDNCGVYAIAPSFVLPYMRGYTDDVEQAGDGHHGNQQNHGGDIDVGAAELGQIGH